MNERAPIPIFRTALNGAQDRWLRRDRVVDFLKSLLWVAPLTLLIWVYAEQEQRTTQPNVPILLNIRSTDPNRIVRVLTRGGDIATADLTASRSRLDLVKSKLEASDRDRPVTIEVDNTRPLGEQEILIAPRVQSASFFVDNNVSVENVHPQSVLVMVDQLEDREIDIRTPPEMKNLAAPPVFEPRTVRVRAPRSALDAAEKTQGGRLYAIANVDANPELMRPGSHDATSVPLLPPPGIQNEELQQQNVKVTLTIKLSDDTLKIESMPVFVSSAKAFLPSVEIECADVVPNVTVVGPPEQIQLIRDKKFIPHATLSIDRTDGFDRPLERTLDFKLPEGVTVVPEDRARPFSFTLKAKQ